MEVRLQALYRVVQEATILIQHAAVVLYRSCLVLIFLASYRGATALMVAIATPV